MPYRKRVDSSSVLVAVVLGIALGVAFLTGAVLLVMHALWR